jgi:hypothetical protein
VTRAGTVLPSRALAAGFACFAALGALWPFSSAGVAGTAPHAALTPVLILILGKMARCND